jgi:hypothetical protein
MHQRSGAKRSLRVSTLACSLTRQQVRQKFLPIHARKHHRPAGPHRRRRVQGHTLDVHAGSAQDGRHLPAPALPDPPATMRSFGSQRPEKYLGLLFVAEERQRLTAEAGERQRLDASIPQPVDHPPPVYRRPVLGPVLFPMNCPTTGPISSHHCSFCRACAITLS